MLDTHELLSHPDTSPRAVIRAGIGVLVFFGLLFSAWGMLVPIHGAVQAQGTVIVDSRRKTVQHLEGGIIQEILVHEGDGVKVGQPLIILADQQARASVELFSNQIDAELASKARLTAEKSGLTAVAFPPELIARDSQPAVAELLQAEGKLFQARLDAINSQVNIFKDQMEQVREENKGLASQQTENAREIKALGEQLGSHRELLEDGYVTRTSVLDLERIHAEKSGIRAQIVASIARNEERLKELESKIVGLQTSRMQEAADELKKSQNRRLELEDRIKAPRDILGRLVVRAPIDGLVVDLKVTTVGGVISGREPLMDIVPVDDQLIVEGRISVDDIAEVRLGQKAEIILTAFKSSSTPPVDGTVTYIAADRLTSKLPAGEIPYYPVHLSIDPAALENAGDLKLHPGMGAVVQIQTRPRTAVDYMLSPLLQRYRMAFRER